MATMPIAGKTYRIRNAYASGRCLDMMGTVSGTPNVALWGSHDGKNQQWYYTGKLFLSAENYDYCLSRDSNSGRSSYNNCDVREDTTVNNKHQELEIIDDGQYLQIRLKQYPNLYLTAYCGNSSSQGSSTGKTTTSEGNVFWRTAIASKEQYWTIEEIGGSSGGNNGGTTIPDVLPKAGKTYNIQNASTGYYLDAMGTAQNGANIAQWGLHGDVNQEWTVVNSTLRSRANTSCYMNSSGSNCVLGGSRMLDFIQNDSTTYGHHVAIRLTGTQLHLTANTAGTGSASGTGTSSKGNVYWAQWEDGLNQRWIFKEDKNLSSGGSTTTGQNLCLPLNNATINVGYKEYAPGYNLDGKPATHYGADWIGRTFTGYQDFRFYASGKGLVVGVNHNANDVVGKWVVVKYFNVKGYGDLIVRYYHMEDVQVAVNTSVTTDTILGSYGTTGQYSSGRHIHTEVDRDVENWQYTPTLDGNSGYGLKAGARGDNDTTINPLSVFKVKTSAPENQTCTVDNDGTWCWGITIPESFK